MIINVTPWGEKRGVRSRREDRKQINDFDLHHVLHLPAMKRRGADKLLKHKLPEVRCLQLSHRALRITSTFSISLCHRKRTRATFVHTCSSAKEIFLPSHHAAMSHTNGQFLINLHNVEVSESQSIFLMNILFLVMWHD